ncbi:MAG: hypothetical protein OSJ27_06285 [Candidatus Gastranaerophilales bacterium]|nr:hypothetical protein [Candidatus Gastranaerophilales bacterium]
MFEILSLVVFAGVFCLFMIVVPSVVEKCTSKEFKQSYLKHLSSAYLHSYGK